MTVSCSKCHEIIRSQDAHCLRFEDTPDSPYIYICNKCFEGIHNVKDKDIIKSGTNLLGEERNPF